MKKLLTAIAALGLIGAPAFAADMAVKAPPPAPAPIPYSWTGFYAGIQFGGGWSNEAVNFTANDPVTANIVNGAGAFGALANGYRISQSGAVGGFEAGYNWQAGANWLLGLETDFSFAGMDGTASGTSVLLSVVTPPIFQTSSAPRMVWDGSGACGMACNSQPLIVRHRRLCLR